MDGTELMAAERNRDELRLLGFMGPNGMGLMVNPALVTHVSEVTDAVTNIFVAGRLHPVVVSEPMEAVIDILTGVRSA